MEPVRCVWNKNASNYKFVLLLTYYLGKSDKTTLSVVLTFSRPNLVFEQEGTLATQLIELDTVFTCSVKSTRA